MSFVVAARAVIVVTGSVVSGADFFRLLIKFLKLIRLLPDKNPPDPPHASFLYAYEIKINSNLKDSFRILAILIFMEYMEYKNYAKLFQLIKIYF